MKVTVTTLADDLFVLDVSEDMELLNFKALCEVESGLSSREIVVMHEGRPLLDDYKDLRTLGIKDGDVVLLQHMVQTPLPTQPGVTVPNLDFSKIQIPGGSRGGMAAGSSAPNPSLSVDDPESIRKHFLSNPEQLALLKHENPKLAESLLSSNREEFAKVLREQQKSRLDHERQRIRVMNADPFDPEAQKYIAEEIKQQNIDSNMEIAMEYHPESFGQVVMLYINCMVNGHPVKAFVDSGAQTTIMSRLCAERCSIMRLVDSRWAGIAQGVGTQKIIGRVHLAQIQIGHDFLTSSFSILEDQPMDMLLGLDMLKRHQCCIDLKRGMLVIGTSGAETPFLTESELPACARTLTGAHGLPHMENEDQQLAEALDRSQREVGQHSQPQEKKSKFPEADIQKLCAMGFSRPQVIEELSRHAGNMEKAIAALLAKALRMP